MHNINRTFLPLAVTASLALSGCGSVEGDFPSLGKRPYERENPIEDTVASAVPLTTTLPADLQKQTDSLLSRSGTAHAAYQSALSSALGVIQSARNSAPGSEAWVNAHAVLSRVDSVRADGMVALGEIDQIVTQQRESGADMGLVALLSAPQQRIADRVDVENAEIERLAKLIGL